MNNLYKTNWSKRPSDVAYGMLVAASEEKYNVIIDIVDRRIQAIGILLFVSSDSKHCTLRIYKNCDVKIIPFSTITTISLKNPWVNILLFNAIINPLYGVCRPPSLDLEIDIGEVVITQ